MSKASELRDQTTDELKAALIDTRKELFHVRNEAKRTKKLEKPHLIRHKRKEIARLKTVIKQKETVEQQ